MTDPWASELSFRQHCTGKFCQKIQTTVNFTFRSKIGRSGARGLRPSWCDFVAELLRNVYPNCDRVYTGPISSVSVYFLDVMFTETIHQRDTFCQRFYNRTQIRHRFCNFKLDVSFRLEAVPTTPKEKLSILHTPRPVKYRHKQARTQITRLLPSHLYVIYLKRTRREDPFERERKESRV